ncbi:MAG: DNA polymerase I [Candidatus Nanopelagicaceae bacterium]|nr:DNA polymerase I [Candidatus Nanopelagicaceae bacterium]
MGKSNSPSERRLLLLDGHSMAYRAFHALPVENFKTTSGFPTNAAYGFTTMLLNLLRDVAPTHIAVAFDVSRKTFRSERFPEYKANRAKTPDEFRSQMPEIFAVVDALGIKRIQKEGFEADDLIATLATNAVAKQFEVEICSGDRDTFQLVTDHITVLYPKKGVSELARMTPEAVFEKYGLTPKQYPDFAALRGDPSDNLPSLAGVGEKTATKWIAEYGSLETLLEKADEISGKVGDSLRSGVEQVKLNHELTHLIRNVEIELKIEDLEVADKDFQQLRQIFDRLEFRALKERINKMDNSSESTSALTTKSGKSREDIKITIIEDAKDLNLIDKSHLSAVAYSLQGEQQFEILISQGGEKNFFLKHAVATAWLENEKYRKIFFDLKPLSKRIVDGILGECIDLALLAYLINPGARTPELSEVVGVLLGKEIAAQSFEIGEKLPMELDFDSPNLEIDKSALQMQAQAILELYPLLLQKADQAQSTKLAAELEVPTAIALANMERIGIAVDTKEISRLETFFAKAGVQAAKEAHKIVGHEFNLSSPKQLQEVLFGELQLPKSKKIKTGYTTDAEALQYLQESTKHPVIDQILRSRDVLKLKSVVEGLSRATAADGRIHTTFQQMVTSTGRLSSTEPNLQNIPIRSEEGRLIRSCFIAGKGFEELMTADYSQIEMRIMAHLSKDEALLAALTSGEDLHTTVGSEVFGVKASEVTSDMRRTIKAMSYGLAYGLSAFGLSQQLGISPIAAQELMNKYFERFGGIRDYLADVVIEARKVGYTETILGRRRYLPDLQSDVKTRRDIAERMALNAPIQGSAADIMKLAMLKVGNAISAAKLNSRILLQVHDELVLEVAKGEANALSVIVRTQMGAAFALNAPLAVNIGLGANWELAAH